MAVIDAEDLNRHLKTKWAAECGMRVRDRRKYLGLTQRHVAKATGFKIPTISRIETGAYLPSEGARYSIANALGTPVVTLWPPLSEERVLEIAGEHTP